MESCWEDEAHREEVIRCSGKEGGHLQPLENKASNYTRSSKGTRMIQQQMSRLLEMDVLAFPSKPMFDAETKICRIKYLNIFMRFFDVKNVYICLFFWGVSALIF